MLTGSANQSAPAEQLTAMQKERIAIIGVGCRFPGGVSFEGFALETSRRRPGRRR